MNLNILNTCTSIEEIPEEILEYIFFHLNPYRDYNNCVLVCKKWKRIVIGVAMKRRDAFYHCVASGHMVWNLLEQHRSTTCIAERYCNSACYLNGCIYLFGGCTASNTTFNDLWIFDLAQRLWIRPVASGTYPSPKAFASMIVWKGQLILFGGWSPPIPYPHHQAPHFFNQLHVYDPPSNAWTQIASSRAPSPVGGHCACRLGNHMIVFGGLHQHNTNSGESWALNLCTMEWSQCVNRGESCPKSRYGATLGAINDTTAIMLGGCGGPNMKFTDCWIMSFTLPNECHWSELVVNNPEYCPHPLWCHPGCKLGDSMAVLSRTSLPVSAEVLQRISAYRSNRNLRRTRPGTDTSSSSDDDEGRASLENGPLPRVVSGALSIQNQRRQQRLAMLQKYEQRILGQQDRVENVANKMDLLKNPMFIHSLDISTFASGYVTWRPPNVEAACGSVPEDTHFYTLVEGLGELIMFGGVHPETGSMQRNNSNGAAAPQLSDRVHILTPYM